MFQDFFLLQTIENLFPVCLMKHDGKTVEGEVKESPTQQKEEVELSK